jgi:NCAIR mutase (PurE)-related protein
MSSDVTFDFPRAQRLGFSEAVLAAGKTKAQLCTILDLATERGVPLLFTRLNDDAFAALPPEHRVRMDHDALSRTAIFGNPVMPAAETRVAVVTAGTSDLAVAREASRTLRFHGQASLEIADVGVAGLWRLMARVEELRTHPVVIVVAGMDAALPSVIGGLIPGLIVAVPTSTGYGVASGGTTALHAALASCAPGIAVVNIDNGYGAACVALRSLKAVGQAPSSR